MLEKRESVSNVKQHKSKRRVDDDRAKSPGITNRIYRPNSRRDRAWLTSSYLVLVGAYPTATTVSRTFDTIIAITVRYTLDALPRAVAHSVSHRGTRRALGQVRVSATPAITGVEGTII